MIATRFVSATAMILAISAFAGTASASPVESSFGPQAAFSAGDLVTQHPDLSNDRALNREAEKRGRKNEAGEDRRGRHGR